MSSLVPSPSELQNRIQSTPRIPVQDRSRARVERILDAAERLLADHETANITMMMLSEASGVGRGTVYQFFPSTLAIWKGLALRYLTALEEDFDKKVLPKDFEHWNDLFEVLIDVAGEFYNENPVAQKILLGSSEGHDLRVADAEWDKRYAEWIRAKFIHLAEDPRMFDIAYLRVLVSANTANLSLSVSEHGRITPFYAAQIKCMAKAYMTQLRDDLLREDAT